MKLKTDEKGNVVLENGHPVYVDESGKDVTVDVPNLFKKLSDLNAENRDRRFKIKELEDQVTMFEGLDPKAAREAMQTLQGIKDKKLLDTEGVESLKKQISEAYEGKLSERDQKIQALNGSLRKALISSQFGTSSVLGKTVLTPDIAETFFGSKFAVDEETGKVVCKPDGKNPLMSRQNPLEPAAFDEAFEHLLEAYPYKDQIMKAGAPGSGGRPGDGKPNPGNLSSFDQKREFIAKHGAEAYREHVRNKQAAKD